MLYMYTIMTKREIGLIRKTVLKLLGVQFVNHYRRKEDC